MQRKIGSSTRLAKVDLVVLRMATYELVFCPDIPSRVSLDEAIEIGKRFGSADSATLSMECWITWRNPACVSNPD